MDRVFISFHNYFRKRRLLFFAGLFAVFGILLWGASKVEFDEDISKLIPSSAQNEKLQQIIESAAFSDRIIIHLQRTSEGSVQDLTNYAEKLLDSLRNNSGDLIAKIQGEVAEENMLETLDFIYQNIPQFLSKYDFDRLSRKLNQDSIENLVATNYKTLISPSGIIAKKTIVRDPLGLSPTGLKKLKKLGSGDIFDVRNGFLVSKDERHLLLFVSPKYKSSETEKNEALVDMLFTIRNNLQAAYQDRVSTQYYGGAIIGVENARQIKKDIQYTVGIALLILILLFIFFYRKLILPIILFTPTLVGGLLAVFCLSVLRTEISAISLGIGSVLIGVTLDYSLHILTHIRNHESVTRVLLQVSRPILMSSLTTALAFLCLLFVDSRALQDLGIFAAISVLGAAIVALLFIPLTYKVHNKEAVKRTFIDRLAAYHFHKNKALTAALILLIVSSVFTYTLVGFNKDIAQLNYTSEEIRQAEIGLDELLNTSSKSVYVVAHGGDLQQALEANDSVFKILQLLDRQNEILSFNSVGALVASEVQQRDRISAWEKFWTPLRKEQIKNDLIKSGAAYGFKPTTHNEFYQLLDADFTPVSLDDYKALGLIDIDDFIRIDSEMSTVTSLVKVAEENLPKVKSHFIDIDHATLIDRVEINETLLGSLQHDFNRLLLYCSILIIFLLLLYFRNWKLWLVTAIPIGLTWLVTVGLMGLLHIDFNVFNVIICSFIFGLGVDYSIFMTNGLILEQQTKLPALATHKTSILLSVITTILGVGVLIFAKHPALYSISIVTVIGITSALLIALTLQPILFNLLIFKSEKKTQQ